MKTCSKCGRELDLKEFAVKKKGKFGVASHCLYCCRIANKRWYENNKEHQKKKSKIRQSELTQENKKLLIEYFLSHPCTDCGETDLRVLEFDHTGEKSHNIACMLQNGFLWTTILSEIAKCEVVCANCHKKRTYGRVPNYRMGL